MASEPTSGCALIHDTNRGDPTVSFPMQQLMGLQQGADHHVASSTRIRNHSRVRQLAYDPA